MGIDDTAIMNAPQARASGELFLNSGKSYSFYIHCFINSQNNFYQRVI